MVFFLDPVQRRDVRVITDRSLTFTFQSLAHRLASGSLPRFYDYHLGFCPSELASAVFPPLVFSLFAHRQLVNPIRFLLPGVILLSQFSPLGLRNCRKSSHSSCSSTFQGQHRRPGFFECFPHNPTTISPKLGAPQFYCISL